MGGYFRPRICNRNNMPPSINWGYRTRRPGELTWNFGICARGQLVKRGKSCDSMARLGVSLRGDVRRSPGTARKCRIDDLGGGKFGNGLCHCNSGTYAALAGADTVFPRYLSVPCQRCSARSKRSLVGIESRERLTAEEESL